MSGARRVTLVVWSGIVIVVFGILLPPAEPWIRVIDRMAGAQFYETPEPFLLRVPICVIGLAVWVAGSAAIIRVGRRTPSDP